MPADVAAACRLAELEIGYRAEAFAGDRVVARIGAEASGASPEFIHQLVRRDGTELTRLRSYWRPIDDWRSEPG